VVCYEWSVLNGSVSNGHQSKSMFGVLSNHFQQGKSLIARCCIINCSNGIHREFSYKDHQFFPSREGTRPNVGGLKAQRKSGNVEGVAPNDFVTFLGSWTHCRSL